jgi:hypothetical protein
VAYENDVLFTREELVDYLTTQSNVIVAVEAGRDDATSARARLDRELAGLFFASPASFAFGGEIWSLQRR